MVTNRNKIWSGSLTGKAIFIYLTTLILCSVLFYKYALSAFWIFVGLSQVTLFFLLSTKITQRWSGLPEKIFLRRIFRTAFFLRVLGVISLYLFYDYMNGNPFEFEAADSNSYHVTALWMLDLKAAGRLSYYFFDYLDGFSDAGYPIFVFINYLVFGEHIIVPRFIQSILGAWMCVLVFKLTRQIFDDNSARIAAIMTMLLPAFIIYAGLHLKETVMLFLLVLFLERVQNLISGHKKWQLQALLILCLGLALFFFRTVLAAAAWFASLNLLLFAKAMRFSWSKRIMILSSVAFAAYFSFPDRIASEINMYMQDQDTNLEAQMRHYSNRREGNVLAKYGRTTLFLPLIFIAPLPTLVDTGQVNALMMNGSNFTRNIYVFFAIIAVYYLYRQKKIRQSIIVLSFLGAYLLILASSGFALSERFHMPALPFLVILASYGISQIDNRSSRFYWPYLLLVILLVISWNWFKLAGRGLI